MRTSVHYLLALALLGVYGVQVCPFLDSLTPLQLGLPLLVALSLQYMLRGPLVRALVIKAPEARRTRRLLALEFGLFASSGIGLGIFNALYHGFPPESGLKVLVGFVTFGFFIAVDLALEKEWRMAERFRAEGKGLDVSGENFPVSRKMALFAAASAVMLTTVFFLVINKDLEWLAGVGRAVPIRDAQISIVKEFAFIAAVLLGEVLNVVRSYARNIRFFFETETIVLQRTNEGDLNGKVPVSTNDEFGVMAHHTNLMVEALRARTEEIERTQDVTIHSLASLAETRDNETGAHILRTQRYVKALAVHMAEKPAHRDYLTPRSIDLLYKSAPLHDIGKVGIRDDILLKPGKHTDAEFEIMKTHAQLGSDALKEAEETLGGSSFLRFAREIAETHHEKWDGSGYPNGLKGPDIPLSGRLMAVADVYDALISKRVYKPAFSHDKAKEIITDGKGKHFDPEVVEAFLAVEGEFMEIARLYGDHEH